MKYYVVKVQHPFDKYALVVGETADKETAEKFCDNANKMQMYESNGCSTYFVEEKEWEGNGRLELKSSENANVEIIIAVPHYKRDKAYGIMSFAEYKDYSPTKGSVWMDSTTEILPLIDGETKEEWLARKKASAERLTKKLNDMRGSIGLKTYGVPECA